jgi:NAD(P)-dependent dehydrogenase (short-subunit alcohol dehydrogenase family)
VTGDPLAGFARYPSLQGRVAFVSGGATGLGAEFVMQLAAQGARVGFVDINRASGVELVAAAASRGYPEPHFMECDVRDVPAMQGAILETAERLGPVTVLVNNAADDQRRRLGELTVELWDDGIAVNVRHHFFAVQTVAPMMREAGGGSIINLGSISAHIDLLDLPSYITAKAGIEGLTRTLARELGPDNIRVNCVIPGWIMTQRQLDTWVTPEAAASIDRNQALKHRLYPDDVARLLLWLAADDSRSCTGQNWIVDGGWIK